MGNAIGKKRKMGTASSTKWIAPEVQAKKDGLSPLGRSYSMPVHHAKPKSDNYHVVALTSSTYGILRVDLPKDPDESRTSISQNKVIGDSRSYDFEEKVRKFEVPEIVVPKPWSDELLSNLKLVSEAQKVKAPEALLAALQEEEPETINMWELMEGLDEDSRSSSPLPVTPPSPEAPVVFHKKVRSLETSLSFSSTHTITEVDADVLEGAVKSELKSAVESDSLIKGKCYTPTNPPHHTSAGRMNAASLPPSRHGSGKENATSSPAVQREAALSTLTPVTLNSSSVNVIPQGTGDSKDSSSVKGIGSLPRTPNRATAGGVSGTEMLSRRVVNDGPILKGPSSSKSMFNSSLTAEAGLQFGPSSAISRRGGVGLVGKGGIPRKVGELEKQQQLRSESAHRENPFSFTTSSSSDDSEEQAAPSETPLFDPELLASFERAIEDVSEDEWYRVRRSDAGVASTSGSSSDGDSPLRIGGAAANGGSVLEGSPLARQPETDANSRKMSFSKVAPVDFRDVVLQKVVRKMDPFEKFEQKCPPGGEERVVIYVTSLRGIRKTFEDCSHMKLVILGYRVAIDERDVSMHADFRQELKELLGMPMPVPRLFIRGRYIGGAEEVSLLHEDGTLAKLLETMPTQTKWEQCDGCGGHRFVPCSYCSGSCKVVTDDNQVVRCTECNENGLVRCPICF